MNTFVVRSSLALAIAIAGGLAALVAPVHARPVTPSGWLPPTLQLTGVWEVQVTLRNCASSAPIASFPAMNLFSADGSSSEVGVGTTPSARYPSFGRWHYIGPRSFSSRFSFFRFAPDQSWAGTQVVGRRITLSGDGRHFTSVAEVSIYDTHHQLLQSGCATEMAVRR